MVDHLDDSSLQRGVHRDVYSLPDLLARAVERDGDAAARVLPSGRVTFTGMYDRAVDAARALLSMGIGRGGRVGILMSNCQEFVDVLLGAQMVGAWPVPINARYKAAELRHVIVDAGLRVLVTTDRIVEHVDFVALLSSAFPDLAGAPDPTSLELADAPDLQTVILFGDRTPPGFMGGDEFVSLASSVDPASVEAARERIALRDVAMMMYTSGTTAMPKGCPICHEALVRPAMEAGRTRFHLTSEDRMWDPLPMFHMSFVLPLIACIDAGASLLSMEYFEPGEAIAYMRSEAATVDFASFPTITEAILNHPDHDPSESTVRLVNNVGPPDVLASMQQRMPNAVQISAYGMTECGGVISFGHVEDTLERRCGTSGRPFRGIEVQIRDVDTDEVLGPDEPGEILVRGWCLFEGYHNDDDKNAEAWTPDGWFRTGDICSLDADGRITYVGRVKDMLKVGGENVAAAEIEGHLSLHPGVMLAQVVSAPDPKYMEVPVAFIQLVDGASTTEDELIDHCRGAIASFKVPRHIRFIDEWPMSATKIQKVRLRERIRDELAAAGSQQAG